MRFLENFNGNGHTISNLYISASRWQGLFPIIKNGGAYKNLKVSQIDISAEEGYVVGYMWCDFPQLQDGTIINCSISNGTVTVRSGVGRYRRFDNFRYWVELFLLFCFGLYI